MAGATWGKCYFLPFFLVDVSYYLSSVFLKQSYFIILRSNTLCQEFQVLRQVVLNKCIANLVSDLLAVAILNLKP